MTTDRELNHAWWEERARLHPDTAMYRPWLEALRRGEPVLDALERDLVGDPRGLRLLHVPCHIGHDTLSWALLGARTTGVDFSETALDVARGLTTELDLDVEWVHADATALPAHLDGRFDVAIASYGAFGWMPDLGAWFAGIRRALVPGGRFVLIDGHPLFFSLRALPDGRLEVTDPVMGGGRLEELRPGTYAEEDVATESNVHVGWCHGLGEIVTGLLSEGFVLEHLAEHDWCVWKGLDGMVREGDRWRMPPRWDGTIPCMFSLVARRPARDDDPATLVGNWGRTAARYAEALGDELEHKPYDREALARLAREIGPGGRVGDVGCGPGHITEHLRTLGLQATGLDSAPEMVEHARAAWPRCTFRVADLFSPAPGGPYAGLICFYALVNATAGQLLPAFAALFASLEPGGRLLLATHVGEGVVRTDDLLGSGLPMAVTLFPPADLASACVAAGFVDVEVDVRPPYPEEHPTDRAYLRARKPAAG